MRRFVLDNLKDIDSSKDRLKGYLRKIFEYIKDSESRITGGLPSKSNQYQSPQSQRLLLSN